MNVEIWADADLSHNLLQLCARGESERLEFKRELPPQKRDFAKSIAALASTSGGTILVGVDDDGALIGVAGGQKAAIRDELCARIVGLCSQIEPPVRPKLLWASANGCAVLCVVVEKGAEPLYYVDGRPYIRHSTVSRPATPAEVQAAIGTPRTSSPSAPKVDTVLSELAGLLANVLRWCDIESDMRSLTPWVEEWKYTAEFCAGRLREFAASDWAVNNKHGLSLERLAEELDEVAGFRHTFGGGANFEEVCAKVRVTANQLIQELVWPVKVDEDSQAAVRAKIIEHARQLDSMWGRAVKNIFDGRVEKAKEESAALGARIAEWTYLPISFLSDELRLQLRKVSLHLVELAAHRIYYDGGESLRRLAQGGQELSNELTEIARKL